MTVRLFGALLRRAGTQLVGMSSIIQCFIFIFISSPSQSVARFCSIFNPLGEKSRFKVSSRYIILRYKYKKIVFIHLFVFFSWPMCDQIWNRSSWTQSSQCWRYLKTKYIFNSVQFTVHSVWYTRLERFWRISLYVTDDATPKLYVT